MVDFLSTTFVIFAVRNLHNKLPATEQNEFYEQVKMRINTIPFHIVELYHYECKILRW